MFENLTNYELYDTYMITALRLYYIDKITIDTDYKQLRRAIHAPELETEIKILHYNFSRDKKVVTFYLKNKEPGFEYKKIKITSIFLDCEFKSQEIRYLKQDLNFIKKSKVERLNKIQEETERRGFKNATELVKFAAKNIFEFQKKLF